MRKIGKPRILILTPAFRPNLGGVETHLEDLTDFLSDSGYKVTVLTYQPITTPIRGKGYEVSKNLKVHRFNWVSGNYFNIFVNWHPVFNFMYLTPYLFIRSFFHLLSHKEDYDLIHAIGFSTAFSAYIFKKIFKKPVVMSTETLYQFKKGSLFYEVCSWLMQDFDMILAESEASAKEIGFLGVHLKKIRVFNHWVNQKKFWPRDKNASKRKLGWEDKFTVLYVGRLIPEKGIDIFLEAARCMMADVQFKIIGDDGPKLPEVKKAEAELANLEYVGKVPYNQLFYYYPAAEVFVYPALYEEDVARTLLESLSCGTPVINTNPGSGVYKLSRKVGFVIKPTSKALEDKIELLYEDRALLAHMTKAAPIFARKFGPRLAKVITDSYCDVLRNSVEG